MKYEYLVQDEMDVLDGMRLNEKAKIKDPVTITVTVEVERVKYEAVKKKYKEPIGEKILKFFK